MERNPPLTSRRIAAHYICTPRGFLKNGVLEIRSDGSVVDIEACPRVDSLAGVEFYNGILIPGLVNAHSHLELSCLRGTIPPGSGFSGFARALREQRKRFSPEEQEAAARYRDARMWAEGVTAVGDVANSAVAFPVRHASRIAYHTFLELYGLKTASTEGLRPVMAAADAAGLPWSLTPHATYSLNRQAFAHAVEADGNTPPEELPPLSIHFMESEAERDLFHRRGDLWEWYREEGFPVDFLAYGSPAERILATVPAGRRLMLVHNTFVTEEEVAALQAAFGDRLTWVLCPRSNRHINGTLPPVDLLRKHGARIAVGTDSLASNADLSLIRELQQFGGVPLGELLGWATATGAAALGMDGLFGALEVGRRPGVVLLDGVDWTTMTLLPSAATRRIA